ncbi:glycosyl hydrolase 92 family protein [Mycobacterium xenopi 4042]|uniref:Glycosyl hydrolase 92 family protein n=1 Tax=Mycobacterium xenopi 4042 TaxID=1299334 RepID=X8CAG8_MYCXE|nr:glycosyl hydrolase 92 family protein [Mycobacterium xenopi 4042]
MRAAAWSQWNAALSRVRVAGAGNDDVKTFYTALYHSLLHPNTFNDADGGYLGFDGLVHTVARGTRSMRTSPTGTPTAAWRHCRRWCFRSGPVTWRNRWCTTLNRVGRCRGGRWRIRRPGR